MLTHIVKNINWVDVALFFLFIRMIFTGVKNGFLTEFFKSLGTLAAIFVSFHYYSYLAAWVAKRINFSDDFWNAVIFMVLWVVVYLFFRLIGDGLAMLFKAEATHAGFDKYAAGIVSVGRGILICRLTMFLILLMHNGRVTRLTLRSYSFKIAGHAALGTYNFLYKNLVDKLFAGQHYNTAAALVLRAGDK